MLRPHRSIATWLLFGVLVGCSSPSGVPPSSTSPPLTSESPASPTSQAEGQPHLLPSVVAFWDRRHGLLGGALVVPACARNLGRCRNAIEVTSDGGATWRRSFTTERPLSSVTTLAGSGEAWATLGRRIAHTSDRELGRAHV